uniref:Uncharacterized protein n=1 Tax=Plectus sambesii TaxID=2011161 RepID=A0A914VUF5_9BILA
MPVAGCCYLLHVVPQTIRWGGGSQPSGEAPRGAECGRVGFPSTDEDTGAPKWPISAPSGDQCDLIEPSAVLSIQSQVGAARSAAAAAAAAAAAEADGAIVYFGRSAVGSDRLISGCSPSAIVA